MTGAGRRGGSNRRYSIVGPTGRGQRLDRRGSTLHVANESVPRIFEAFEPATVVKYLVREALEKKHGSDGAELVNSDQARW